MSRPRSLFGRPAKEPLHSSIAARVEQVTAAKHLQPVNNYVVLSLKVERQDSV